MNRGLLRAGATIVCLTVTLSARADFVPVSGLLRASATASTTTGGTQTHSPPDVTLDGSPGTFAHGAHAAVGSASSDILVRSVRSPLALTQDVASDTVFFVNGNAFNSGRVEDVFDVTAGTQVRINLVGDPGAVWGLTLRDASNAVIYNRVNMGGTITEFIDLASGRYTAVSAGGSFGPAALDQAASATITIVPEPTLTTFAGALLCGAAFARPRRAVQ